MRSSMFIHYLAEQGALAAMPGLVALGVFALGLVIHFRNLDDRWRRAFLALTPIPLLLGITAFCSEMREDSWNLIGSVPDNQLIRECLLSLQGNMPVVVVASFATLVLLAMAALLSSPLRSWRPTSVLALWAGSLMMILMSYFGIGFVFSALKDLAWSSHFSYSARATYPENHGIIMAIHSIFLNPYAPFIIILWLLLCGFLSLRAKQQETRKNVAWIVFTVCAFMAIISAMVLIKAIVFAFPSHPAIAGRSWVTLLGVESW